MNVDNNNDQYERKTLLQCIQDQNLNIYFFDYTYQHAFRNQSVLKSTDLLTKNRSQLIGINTDLAELLPLSCTMFVTIKKLTQPTIL